MGMRETTEDDEDKGDEPELKRQRKLPDSGISRPSSSSGPSGSHRVRSTKESILLSESTIFIANGAFKIVKRMDQNVPSYYVGCPVHSYQGGGRRRPCVKAISITQPDEETVLLRLRKWILAGWAGRLFCCRVQLKCFTLCQQNNTKQIDYFYMLLAIVQFSNEWMGPPGNGDELILCIVASIWVCLNLVGLQMERLDGESDEDFRRRHVKYVSWLFFTS